MGSMSSDRVRFLSFTLTLNRDGVESADGSLSLLAANLQPRDFRSSISSEYAKRYLLQSIKIGNCTRENIENDTQHATSSNGRLRYAASSNNKTIEQLQNAFTFCRGVFYDKMFEFAIARFSTEVWES